MFSLNQTIFLAIHHFAGRNAIADTIGIFFAEWFPYFLVLGFLILLFSEKDWRKRLYWFAEGAIAIMVARGLVTEVIRLVYHEARPFSFFNITPLIAESGWAFPSGHAAWFFAMAMTIWYFNKRWGAWFFGFAVVNGIARIYVGVHWPFDIVAGAVVGILSAVGVHALLGTSRKELYGSTAVSKSELQPS